MQNYLFRLKYQNSIILYTVFHLRQAFIQEQLIEGYDAFIYEDNVTLNGMDIPLKKLDLKTLAKMERGSGSNPKFGI